MVIRLLLTSSFAGLGTGSFRPSPHPMESFITVTASAVINGSAVSKDFITHARTYNFKITTVPEGFPVIIEEFMCPQSPCIVSQMAHTNTGFSIQQIAAKVRTTPPGPCLRLRKHNFWSLLLLREVP
jgi:hypothetical protein